MTFSGFCQEADSLEDKGSFAIFPAVSYAPETSLQLGAATIWVLKRSANTSHYVRESTLTPYFLYTLKNQFISAGSFNKYFSSGDFLQLTFRFFNFPDFYFGLGNDNDPEIKESYTNVFGQLQGRYFKPLSDESFLGMAFDLQANKIKDIVEGGILQVDSPIGFDGGTLFGMGPAYRYDSRNNTIYPSNGYFVSVSTLFNYIGDFNYVRYTADMRRYIELWNEDNILAFQVQGSFTSGNDVPFYKLPQLGGDERLRGITNASLYRDRQRVYTQVEYRRPLFWRFGMTVFAGVGDVAYDIADFNIPDMKYVVGIGGRFLAIPSKKLNLRMDIGIAKGGQSAIYIGASEAF
ncbi:MAG: hypothetical protein Tsb0034_09470 [Ekhidna sp.]